LQGVRSATAAPAQTPFVQTSPLVQALPSLQDVPFALAGLEHWPVFGSQVPAVWHWSEAVQVTRAQGSTQIAFVQTCVLGQLLEQFNVLPHTSIKAVPHWPG